MEEEEENVNDGTEKAIKKTEGGSSLSMIRSDRGTAAIPRAAGSAVRKAHCAYAPVADHQIIEDAVSRPTRRNKSTEARKRHIAAAKKNTTY